MLLLQEIKMVIGDRFYISTEKLFLNDFYEILKVINLGLFLLCENLYFEV